MAGMGTGLVLQGVGAVGALDRGVGTPVTTLAGGIQAAVGRGAVRANAYGTGWEGGWASSFIVSVLLACAERGVSVGWVEFHSFVEED